MSDAADIRFRGTQPKPASDEGAPSTPAIERVSQDSKVPSSPPGSPSSPLKRSTSWERAISGASDMAGRVYNPGEVRVRLDMLKDWMRVMKARWMGLIYRLALLCFLVQLAPRAWSLWIVRDEVKQAQLGQLGDVISRSDVMALVPALCVALTSFLLKRRNRSVYLLDFALFKAPEEWKVSKAQIVEMMRNAGKGERSFDEDDLKFMEKILANSGTGDATAWPPGIIRCLEPGVRQDQSMEAARKEADTVICSCLQDLFDATGIKPKQVDFLIINCSLFSPTPSLCAMAANKFKMRMNVRTYNLSGMGCSASLLAVDLASELLQNNPNSIAVVVSTELITQSLYHGHLKGMLLQNTLFRCGGAAICLTNKSSLVGRAKYRLRHLVRTQATNDESYNCVYQCQDETGQGGVRLSKDIVRVAGDAMKRNLTELGPLVLPIHEQARVAYYLLRNKLVKHGTTMKYVPNFKSAFDYFCIHAGGRAVLDGIEKSLRLHKSDLEASRSVLHDYGNTSSSSIWYELRYIERHKPLRRGHSILQLAFGSGFKCNSACWTRLRS